MRKERGLVFSRVGHHYEVEEGCGLKLTVPVTQYISSILPMGQVEGLRLSRLSRITSE